MCNTNIIQYKENVFENPIAALCAAHNLLLFAACTGNQIKIISHEAKTLQETLWWFNYLSDQIFIEFSPYDTHVCIYSGHRLVVKTVSDINKRSACQKFGINIRKVFFSPDNTRIAIAFVDGELCMMTLSDLVEIKRYGSNILTWRCKDVADVDAQSPRVLWSIDNMLFTLDSANHTDSSIYTFVIRKASNGKFISACKFFPNNPIAMGLTKNERSVVFVHKDDTGSQLDLFDEQDTADIDFITKKAHWYQLFCLWQACKAIKVFPLNEQKDLNVKLFVSTIRSQITDMRKGSI